MLIGFIKSLPFRPPANQSPAHLQTALARAPDDPEHVGRLVAGRDQRPRGHGRPLLDARHHHPRPRLLLQARGAQPGRRPRDQAEQEALLQSQVERERSFFLFLCLVIRGSRKYS